MPQHTLAARGGWENARRARALLLLLLLLLLADFYQKAGRRTPSSSPRRLGWIRLEILPEGLLEPVRLQRRGWASNNYTVSSANWLISPLTQVISRKAR